MGDYLTAGQASREAVDVLIAAGLTGNRGARVSSRIGMQPLGARELVDTEITLCRTGDYDAAMTALLRAFPDANGYSTDNKKVIRISRYTGRIAGGGGQKMAMLAALQAVASLMKDEIAEETAAICAETVLEAVSGELARWQALRDWLAACESDIWPSDVLMKMDELESGQ